MSRPRVLGVGAKLAAPDSELGEGPWMDDVKPQRRGQLPLSSDGAGGPSPGGHRAYGHSLETLPLVLPLCPPGPGDDRTHRVTSSDTGGGWLWCSEREHECSIAGPGHSHLSHGAADPGKGGLRTQGHAELRSLGKGGPGTQGPRDPQGRGAQERVTQGPTEPRSHGARERAAQGPRDPQSHGARERVAQGPRDPQSHGARERVAQVTLPDGRICHVAVPEAVASGVGALTQQWLELPLPERHSGPEQQQRGTGPVQRQAPCCGPDGQSPRPEAS
uniref:Uncharacterized protein n=1 Tax=Rangifer tarandus platyrhynchus TaxID=3082113 RepID=A0ACB0FGP4_RANTA|nr:unnamed protein product [Rangifer tarandus platyrhynchus]